MKLRCFPLLALALPAGTSHATQTTDQAAATAAAARFDRLLGWGGAAARRR